MSSSLFGHRLESCLTQLQIIIIIIVIIIIIIIIIIIFIIILIITIIIKHLSSAKSHQTLPTQTTRALCSACLCLFLSFRLSVCLSLLLSAFRTTFQSLTLLLDVFFNLPLCTCLSVSLRVSAFVSFRICGLAGFSPYTKSLLSIYLFHLPSLLLTSQVFLSVLLSINVSLPVCLSACLSLCLSLCLSVSLPVCHSFCPQI